MLNSDVIAPTVVEIAVVDTEVNVEALTKAIEAMRSSTVNWKAESGPSKGI